MTTTFTAGGNLFSGADITTQGANGRDQAGAFGSTAQIYWWNTNLGLVASLSDSSPAIGSAGCMIGTIKLVGSAMPQATFYLDFAPNFGVDFDSRFIPQRVFYDAAIAECSLGVVSAVSSTPTTSVSTAGFVPTQARFATIEMYSANGGSVNNSFLGYRSGITHAKATSAGSGYDTLVATMPNISQTIYTANQYSGGGTELFVLGYEI